jgi:hypothetical protein
MPVEALKVEATYVGASLDKGLKDAQKQLAATAKEANALDSSLARGLKKGSNEAGQSLVNLGRIAQDAPFGFIGIQNNINPLLESFGRLKTETGSTGGALKALASGLVGAGGIGLAVSVITSAITFATMGFRAWTGSVKENKEAIDKTKSAYDSIISSLGEEQVKIDKIVSALKTETLTRDQRRNAIEQLQKAAPAYFATLNKETASIAQITSAYDKFSQSIIKSIEARVREKELITVTEEILKLQDKATKLGQDEVLINGKLVKVNRQRFDANSESLSTQEAYNATLNGTLALTTEENKRLIDLQKTRQNLLKLVTDASGADPFISTQKTAKTKKDVQTVNDVLAELQREISFLNQIQLTFGTNEAATKIKEIESTVKKLVKDFKVDPQDTIVQKLLTGGKFFNIVQGLNIPGIQGLTDQVFKTIETEFNSGTVPTITIPLNIQTAIQGLNEGQQGEIQKFLTDATSEVEGALEGLFENIGTTIGNTLGRALAGSASIGDLFKGIFNQLGASMQELGKFFIQTGIQIKLIKAFLIKNPALAIAGGIALVALGSLIQAKTNVPGFATGGTAPGGSILVGERGPEIITAPRGATITPNAQTNAILNGGNSGGTVVFKIQGRELVGILNNTNASLSRSGQN